MSNAVNAAKHASRSLRPTRLPPRIRKKLRRDEDGLPIPHVNLVVRQTNPSRFADHYYNTLQDDLLYMTYKHESGPRREPRQVRLTYDPEDPYVQLRDNPPVGGMRLGKRAAPQTTDENVVCLKRIQLHTMVRNAAQNRMALLGPIAMLRALSGETEHGGGIRTSEGVQVVRAVTSVPGWARAGFPIGAKVNMRGPKMYEFLNTLTEFVLPRLKEFTGVVLPPASANLETPAGVAGVVSFGLGPEAMPHFPQLEVNIDAYPKMYGMHIHFITDAVGIGAQEKARQLVSGFGIPFRRA